MAELVVDPLLLITNGLLAPLELEDPDAGIAMALFGFGAEFSEEAIIVTTYERPQIMVLRGGRRRQETQRQPTYNYRYKPKQYRQVDVGNYTIAVRLLTVNDNENVQNIHGQLSAPVMQHPVRIKTTKLTAGVNDIAITVTRQIKSSEDEDDT